MKISTLSIGDELLCGQLTDTNAGTIAAALLAEGLRIQRHLAVGDNDPDITEALNDLNRVSDAIIVTGGLGPTADDLTSRAAARATGRRLVINEEARAHARTMSGRLENLIVCPLNDKQAMIPTKSALIPNPNGTACGFHLMHDGCFMFFMPGVPSEMIVMLRETVIPLYSGAGATQTGYSQRQPESVRPVRGGSRRIVIGNCPTGTGAYSRNMRYVPLDESDLAGGSGQ